MENVAAERAVLAGLFQYGNNTLVEISDILDPDIFTTDINRVLHKCLVSLLENEGLNFKPDIASILSAASKLGLSEHLEKDKAMLRAISNFPVEKENVRKECGSIYKLHLARKGILKLQKAERELERITGDETLASIIQMVEKPSYEFSDELRSTKSSSTPKIGEGISEYLSFLANNPCRNVGISTGFPEWEHAIGGGPRKGAVALIAARPKTGKTFLCDNMGLHISMNVGIPCLNLDTEMSREEHMTRILAILSGIPMEDIETGKFAENSDSAERLRIASEQLKEAPYHIESICGKPFDEILGLIRRWIVKDVGLDSSGKALPCVIIYDYIKLMDSSAITRDLKEYQVLGFQLSALNDLMSQYQSTGIALVQLNRDEDVSQSDRLTWFCASLTLFKKKSPEEMASDGIKLGTRKLEVKFCRHGPGTDEADYVSLTFDGSRGRLKEVGLLSKLQGGGHSHSPKERNDDNGESDIKF